MQTETTKCGICGEALPTKEFPRLCWKCWDAEQDRRDEYRDDREADERLNAERESEV